MAVAVRTAHCALVGRAVVDDGVVVGNIDITAIEFRLFDVETHARLATDADPRRAVLAMSGG